MNVFCVTSAMRMAMSRFGGNDVELAMPDTAFGHQALRKANYHVGFSAQNYRFETILVIQVDMHCRHCQIVMVVLNRREALGQFPGMVVIDV